MLKILGVNDCVGYMVKKVEKTRLLVCIKSAVLDATLLVRT